MNKVNSPLTLIELVGLNAILYKINRQHAIGKSLGCVFSTFTTDSHVHLLCVRIILSIDFYRSKGRIRLCDHIKQWVQHLRDDK